MTFSATITGKVVGVAVQEFLKHSEGLEVRITPGLDGRWVTDEQFMLVFPRNDMLGSMFEIYYPNYYYSLYEQISPLTQTKYDVIFPLTPLGTVVWGYVTETTLRDGIKPDTMTVTPGNYPVVYVEALEAYYTIIPNAGEYTIKFSKALYHDAYRTVITKEHREGDAREDIRMDAELVFIISSSSGVLTGDVYVAELNTPLPGARIQAEPGSGLAVSTTTDGNGRYYLPLPSGAYTVKIFKDGYSKSTESLFIAPDEVKEYDRWLAPVKVSFVSGRIRYFVPPNTSNDIRLDLMKKDADPQHVQTIYAPANATSFRFDEIKQVGQYGIIASLISLDRETVYGKVLPFQLRIGESKKVLLELSNKQGYYQNAVTNEEMDILSNPSPRKDIKLNYPIRGMMSMLTTQTPTIPFRKI